MDLNLIIQTVDSLYNDYNGWKISQKNIDKQASFSRAMKYDEASTESFLHALELTKPTQNDIFLDLGSGLGKKVIAAALQHQVKKCVGIELLEDLYTASNEVLQRVKDNRINISNSEFILGNYYDLDFSYASIIHISISPTMIDFQLDGILGEKLKQLKKGTRLIISDIPIGYSEFYLIKRVDYDFPSRKDNAFIYEKIS